MKYEITEDFLKDVDCFYQGMVKKLFWLTVGNIYFSAIVYNVASLNLGIASKMIYSIYVLYVGSLVCLIGLAVTACYKAIVRARLRKGKFTVRKTKRKLIHFVNVSKRKKDFKEVVYVRALLDNIFVEGIK